jgi:hypothetical protein
MALPPAFYCRGTDRQDTPDPSRVVSNLNHYVLVASRLDDWFDSAVMILLSIMPHRLCPVCHRVGRLLEDSSRNAVVEYYRCDPCGQVWSHRKADPEAPAVAVTETPQTPDQRPR